MALLAIGVGLANHGLAPFAAFQDGTGSPTVRPFSTASAPAGWTVAFQAEYPWATQYFGPNATYTRYIVEARLPGGSASNGVATFAAPANLVYADVVRTDDKGSLDAYNLQNCFLFHNYNIATSQRIDVGNGVTALLLNYDDPATKARWATVSWAWPVDNKGATYYERVALTSSLLVSGPDADVSPSGGVNGFFVNVLNLLNGSHDDPKLATLYKNADGALKSAAASLISFAVSSPDLAPLALGRGGC